MLELVDRATADGWTLRRCAQVLGVTRVRLHRWLVRRDGGNLDDARPGGHPVHGLLAWEADAILALFDEWGEIDGSYRKLAHRGC